MADAAGPRRRRGAGGASFIIADGKMLLVDSGGTLVVAKISPTGCNPIAAAKVLGPDRAPYSYVTIPVLVDGRIYCRNTSGELVCLDVSA